MDSEDIDRLQNSGNGRRQRRDLRHQIAETVLAASNLPKTADDDGDSADQEKKAKKMTGNLKDFVTFSSHVINIGGVEKARFYLEMLEGLFNGEQR